MKKYSITMNAGAFSDILPEGAGIYFPPELPKLKFKANKVEYTVTDLRLLHPAAMSVLEMIINAVINIPSREQVSFEVGNVDEDTIEIVLVILLNMRFTARKKGRNGFEFGSCFLLEGFDRKDNVITFHLIREHAKAIYMYAHENQKKQINIQDLVFLLTENSRRQLLEVLEVKP